MKAHSANVCEALFMLCSLNFQCMRTGSAINIVSLFPFMAQ